MCWVAGLYHKVTFCCHVDWCSRSALEPPCIMCVQYRGRISWVPWGDIMSTVGGYHEYRGGISWVPWGDILSTVGVFSTVGGFMINVGGYHDKCGGISWVPWGYITMHVGDIMSTVEGVQYRGGKIQLLFEYPTVLNTPHGTHDIPPHASWYPPTVLKFQRMVSPHGTEHPPRYSWYPPTCIMISPHMHHDIPPRYSNFKGWYPPTVLNTLHGTHDIPPCASWYPPWYWTSPTVLKITPHGTHESPHGTEHPHGTQDIPPRYSWYPPTVLMISPHGTEHPPQYWTPPTVLHTHYTGWERKTAYGLHHRSVSMLIFKKVETLIMYMTKNWTFL